MVNEPPRRVNRPANANFPPAAPAASLAAVPTAAHQRSRRRLVELALIGAVSGLIGWLAFPHVRALQDGQKTIQDQIIELSSDHPPLSDFVFVAIDDASMKLDQLWPEDIAASPALKLMEAGWPWARPVYAAALDRLVDAGARLVIFDLVFDAAKPGDEVFRESLDRHRTKVVLGANFTRDAISPDHLDIASPSLNPPAESLIPDPWGDPRVGFVNFEPDVDKKVRTARYLYSFNGRPLPSLSGAAARQLEPARELPPRARFFRFADRASIRVVPFFSLFVPTDWEKTLRCGAIFRDKIVIVGPSAAILQDNHLVAGGNTMPGPLIHVHALSALLGGRFYDRAGTGVQALSVLLAALTAFALTVWLGRRPLAALLGVVASLVALLVVTYLAARWADYLPPVVQPGFTLLLAGVTGIAWNFARERRESGRMRSMLERYISRNLVREVLDNREDFLSALGGTRRPVTVFFSDVRGFTSVSEREDAGKVVEQLNEYLGEMVAVIFRHQGTVDKFMGDGIMAVWGNVVSESPAIDARRAVEAALEMQARIAALNERWSQRGLPAFHVGMGLNHGEAVFGNIGSAEKMEPTVIGDAVNLASRVEGLTKTYGVPLLITQSVATLLENRFRLRSVDLVRVMGKLRPTEVLTVLGPPDVAVSEWITLYEGGMADYRAHRFAPALEQFRAAHALAPQDRLCGLYVARTERFLAEPPPADWDGADSAASK